MHTSKFKSFQRALLKWYQKNARDLPWRKTKNPYAIWVSEIMLQQTQVDTVIPYYEKWMKRFPTIQKLSKAPLSEAMKYWAGLGYYRRVRMLHKAAGEITRQHNGTLPETPSELQEIHGIGPYTAGAIASIAFEQKAPILDGNVIRILTRLFAINKDISQPKTIKTLWVKAEDILPDQSLGDFNQALMELGALICEPDNPKCSICPVSRFCVAKQQGRETSYPVKKKNEKLQKIKTAALVYEHAGKYWIQKQPKDGRWGGLWMFPHWKNRASMIKDIKSMKIKPVKFMTIKHGFTKYQVSLEVYKASSEVNISKPNNKLNRLVSGNHLSKFAFPAPHKKIVSKITYESRIISQ